MFPVGLCIKYKTVKTLDDFKSCNFSVTCRLVRVGVEGRKGGFSRFYN